MTEQLITNATWAADGSLVDILIDGKGGLTRMPNGIDEKGILLAAQIEPAGQIQVSADVQRLDAQGQFVLPALVDLHVKVSQGMKSSSKATKLASNAARKGGVGSLLAMPSKAHQFDHPAAIDSFVDAVAANASCKMQAAGYITIKGEGEQQSPYNTLAARGLHIFTDVDHAPSNMLMLYRAMQYIADIGLTFALRADVPQISAHCPVHLSESSYLLGMHGCNPCAEEIGTETILRLAATTKAKVHLQCVSTAESVNIIRRNKGQATAEVALHHLLFTHKDIGDYNTSFKTLPPLREQTDCDALIAGLQDGTIDCIVSDHCACSEFAKKQEFPTAPQGVLGLDTYLQAIYTHLIKTGKLSWAQLLQCACVRPCEILTGKKDEALPIILFNPKAKNIITPEQLPSGTINSPFLHQELEGEVCFL